MTSQTGLPNFLIVGASKSGTTSLYRYLQHHPEVFLPGLKEPRFFVAPIYRRLSKDDPRYEILMKDTVFTPEDYANLFSRANNAKAIGEASVAYLYYYHTSIPLIKKYLGDVKIIIMLRNPVDRAFSAYTHLRRDRFETLSFEECLNREEDRRANNWSMLNFFYDAGLYYRQVKAFMEQFRRVKVYLLDELIKENRRVLKDTCNFLEVDPSFVPDFKTRYNVSGIPKNQALYSFFTKPNTFKRMVKPFVNAAWPREKREKLVTSLIAKTLTKPRLNPQTRRRLVALYREDILKLQTLLRQDLSHWLK